MLRTVARNSRAAAAAASAANRPAAPAAAAAAAAAAASSSPMTSRALASSPWPAQQQQQQPQPQQQQHLRLLRLNPLASAYLAPWDDHDHGSDGSDAFLDPLSSLPYSPPPPTAVRSDGRAEALTRLVDVLLRHSGGPRPTRGDDREEAGNSRDIDSRSIRSRSNGGGLRRTRARTRARMVTQRADTDLQLERALEVAARGVQGSAAVAAASAAAAAPRINIDEVRPEPTASTGGTCMHSESSSRQQVQVPTAASSAHSKDNSNAVTDTDANPERSSNDKESAKPTTPTPTPTPDRKAAAAKQLLINPVEEASGLLKTLAQLSTRPNLDPRRTMPLFRRLVKLRNELGHTKEGDDITADVCQSLIHNFPEHDLLSKFDVLRYRIQRSGSGGGSSGAVDVGSYRTVCDSIERHVRQQKYIPKRQLTPQAGQQVVGIVKFLHKHLSDLDEVPYQTSCLPRLMRSALTVPSEQSWDVARQILDYVTEKSFPMDGEVYGRVLGLSSYRNSMHFPFWRILKVLTYDAESDNNDGSGDDAIGIESSAAVNILSNEYPYTDTVSTKSILRSILTLRRAAAARAAAAAVGSDDDRETEDAGAVGDDFRPDLGTLEQVTAGGARLCDPDMVLLAWDLAEECGYRPTVGMYEAAVQAFASAGLQDHNAFAVLAEMEEAGHVPSRAVIKSVARHIKQTSGRLDNAYYILTNGTEGTKITVSSLNCITAACAAVGDVDGAFSTLDDFDRYDVSPNGDTLSYLMESVGTDMSDYSSFGGLGGPTADKKKAKEKDARPVPEASGRDLERYLEAADGIVAMAEERRNFLTTTEESSSSTAASSHHLLHQYMRVLCAGGELDRALVGLEGAVERTDRILFETFPLVAVSLARGGRFEDAQYVAKELYRKAGYGDLPVSVWNRIKKLTRDQRR